MFLFEQFLVEITLFITKRKAMNDSIPVRQKLFFGERETKKGTTKANNVNKKWAKHQKSSITASR